MRTLHIVDGESSGRIAVEVSARKAGIVVVVPAAKASGIVKHLGAVPLEVLN